MVESNGSSSSSAEGGSSEMVVTFAAWMHEDEVGYLAICMESRWVVRMSVMPEVLSQSFIWEVDVDVEAVVVLGVG